MEGRCLFMHDMKPELSLLEEETGDRDGSRDVLGRVSKWEKGAHQGIVRCARRGVVSPANVTCVSGWKDESRERAGMGKWERAVGLDLAHW